MDGAYRVPPDRVRVDILVPGDGRWMWVGSCGGRVGVGGGLGGVGWRSGRVGGGLGGVEWRSGRRWCGYGWRFG